ncbi:MAG: 1-acyl-sn-glycerol-3-phosphate acyltransferase [Pseudomonadota bacterium]
MTASSAERAMTTWNDHDPPALAPPTMPERVRGGFRVCGLILVTAVCLGIFLLGRALRHYLGRWVTFHFGAARAWSRICLWLTGLRHEVEGMPIARGALMANHCSWIDILALRASRLIYFVSKAEVANWPGIGFITRVAGTVFIERRRVEAKRQEQILLERIRADQVLCIFPEGTSTDGQRVLPFKSSLFSAFHHDGHGEELMVQPVSIRYMPAAGSGLPPSFYGWWGTMGFEAHIWDVCCRSSGGVAKVIFHPPVRPTAFANRKALAAHCQLAVTEGHVRAGGPLLAAPET